MRLSVIGARAGMPAPGEPSSGYLLQTERTTLLFDCGPGVAGALRPADLDAVFVSHLHLDHCYDPLPVGKSILAPLVPYPRTGAPVELAGDPPMIPLHVPVGGAGVLRTLQSLFPVVSSPPLDRVFELAFEVHEYEPEEGSRSATARSGRCRSGTPSRHAGSG